MKKRRRDADHVLVVAAGQGERAGGPKALIPVGGRAWYTIQQDRLARTRLSATWVVSEEVERAMAAHADAPTHRVVADPAAPMFASVIAGLRSLLPRPPGAVFVLPVDVPAPDREVFDLLRAGGSIPAMPICRKVRGHPVRLPWGFVERVILPAAGNADARLDRLIAAEVVEVPVEDPCVAMNLNGVGEFEKFIRP